MDSTGARVGGKVKKGAAGCKTGGPRKTGLQFLVGRIRLPSVSSSSPALLCNRSIASLNLVYSGAIWILGYRGWDREREMNECLGLNEV
jgi:hypothetical protein